jgi:hypothetical protein
VASLAISNILGSPAFRRSATVALLLGAMALAILGPWSAELLGLVDPSMTFDPGLRVLTMPTEPDMLAMTLGLAVFVVLIVVVGAVVALRRARHAEEAERRVHLRAWRLEQLVPAPRCRR